MTEAKSHCEVDRKRGLDASGEVAVRPQSFGEAEQPSATKPLRRVPECWLRCADHTDEGGSQ